MNTIVSTMKQHQSHANSLGFTMTAFKNKLYAGPYKSCTQKPQKTKNKRGSQSMVITEDRERGTIRALRETQKGGELPLMTIYIYIHISLCTHIYIYMCRYM